MTADKYGYGSRAAVESVMAAKAYAPRRRLLFIGREQENGKLHDNCNTARRRIR